MDFETKHDPSLDLPLAFPEDEAEATTTRPSTQQQPPPPQRHERRQTKLNAEPNSTPAPARTPSPTFTVYIRVPGPRNGFEDPPDVNWSQEKDDALWRILSRASKDDINWDELADKFGATVDFLLIQSNILTRRHFSQVRAQTRKAVLGARDSPLHSPSPTADRSPSGAARTAARRPSTPSAEAMGRTASGGGAVAKKLSAEAMRRTSSAQAFGTPASGSRRPSGALEPGQPRPRRPSHPAERRPSGTARPKPRLTSLPLEASPSPTAGNPPLGRRISYDQAIDDAEPESPAATSTQPSDDDDSSDSSPSLPVMSRIFKRPPGHPQPQDAKDGGGGTPKVGSDGAGFGNLNLGTLPRESGVSDNSEESETQPAFLPFKSPTLAAASGSTVRRTPRSWQARQPQKDISPSSSSSASPTAKAFASPPAVRTPTNATSAAAARLQSSRLPGIVSPPVLHPTSSSGRGLTAPRIGSFAREGSDAGTTPSMSSSFSDLDDVSLTQSVLDEALASRVEDTLITPGSVDTLSLSGTNTAAPSRRPH